MEKIINGAIRGWPKLYWVYHSIDQINIKMGKKKTKKTIILVLAAVFLLLVLPGFYNALAIRHYSVDAHDITHPIKIALITDLHSCSYGKEQTELLDAIDHEAPDVILLGGDIFDDELEDDNTAVFLEGIGKKYPCYYVTGNHEYWSGAADFAKKMMILEACGIMRLDGKTAAIEVNGSRIMICGVDDPYAFAYNDGFTEHPGSSFTKQLAEVAGQTQEDVYTILLTHRPELIDIYTQYSFDLVLAGHAHGGQWRIPGILNGLFAPNQGLFPKYAGGSYELNGTRMIVSRGLAKESTRIPRWYNRPEVVIVELLPAAIAK